MSKKSLLALGTLGILGALVIIVLAIFLWKDGQRQADTVTLQNKLAVLQSENEELKESLTDLGAFAVETEEEDATPTTTTPTPPATTTAKVLKVFFGKNPETDTGFTNMTDFVFPVTRSTDRTDVLTFVIEEFIKGPTAAEKTNGYFQGASQDFLQGTSDCSGKDFQVSLNSGKATVRFCRTVMGVGTLGDAVFLQSIKESGLQFKNITAVEVLDKDNKPLFDARGEVACEETSDEGRIVVYFDCTGISAATYFTLKGAAKGVFENVVNYKLLSASGAVLVEGYVHAMAPDYDQWGGFSTLVQFVDQPAGTGKIQVYWTDAATGSPRDVVEVPVVFQ